jgi:hypothetical protein
MKIPIMTHTMGADYQRYPTDMNVVALGECSRKV